MQNYLIETYNILSWKDPWGLSSPTPGSKGQTQKWPQLSESPPNTFWPTMGLGTFPGELVPVSDCPWEELWADASLSSPGQLPTRDGEQHPAPPSAPQEEPTMSQHFPLRHCLPAIVMEGSACQCLHWDLPKSGGQNKGCTANQKLPQIQQQEVCNLSALDLNL